MRARKRKRLEMNGTCYEGHQDPGFVKEPVRVSPRDLSTMIQYAFLNSNFELAHGDLIRGAQEHVAWVQGLYISRWWPESTPAQNVFTSQMLKIHTKIYIHFSPFEYESPLSSLNTQSHKQCWLHLSIGPLLMPSGPIFPHLQSKGVKMIIFKEW